MILTLSKNGSLGETSTMNWTVKEDKEWFRRVTNNVGSVVMGRKTFETMENKHLPNRINYIITRDPTRIVRSEFVFPVTYDQFKELRIKDYCVIGGYEIYHLFKNDVPVVYISYHKNVEVDGRKLNLDVTNCILFQRTESENLMKEIWIRHPYQDQSIRYSYGESKYLDRAKYLWENKALERLHPTATVYVKDDQIVGEGGNGILYETYEMCERVKLHVPTGQRYDLCNGNHLPINHSEQQAVRDADSKGNLKKLKGATANLYGHWWSCQGCTECMVKEGISEVIYSESWTKQFLGIIDL